VKLLRTFAAQTEALQRYRGKGQQKVTVEHVHVHTGGQAIVGSVSQSGGGAPSPMDEGECTRLIRDDKSISIQWNNFAEEALILCV
jgi:hypothetical protein